MHRRWQVVLAWAIVVEVLMVWPRPPELPSGVAFQGSDKIVHAVLFGVLALLAGRALLAEGRPWWPSWVGTALFGAATEWQQHFIPTRGMDIRDLLADVAGATLGLAMLAVLARPRRELGR